MEASPRACYVRGPLPLGGISQEAACVVLIRCRKGRDDTSLAIMARLRSASSWSVRRLDADARRQVLAERYVPLPDVLVETRRPDQGADNRGWVVRGHLWDCTRGIAACARQALRCDDRDADHKIDDGQIDNPILQDPTSVSNVAQGTAATSLPANRTLGQIWRGRISGSTERKPRNASLDRGRCSRRCDADRERGLGAIRLGPKRKSAP